MKYIYNMSSPQLVVMTFNVAQLPWPLGMSGLNCGDAKKRMAYICKQLLLFHTPPHIIAFQELFSDEAKDVVRSILGPVYNISYDTDLPKYLIGVNSGLAILIRKGEDITIKKVAQYTYRKYRGIEVLAKKGIRALTFTAHSRDVHVFTTHIQTGGRLCIEPCLACCATSDEDSTLIKLQQLEELAEFIKYYTDGYELDPAFVVGDFNIEMHIVGAMSSLERLGFLMTRDAQYPGGARTSVRSEIKIIDFILAKNVGGFSYITECFGNASDHNAVIGYFTE